MSKRQDKVRERALATQQDLSSVRIDRGADFDLIDGYVVGVGAHWLLLAVLDHAVVLDGHTALRMKDVHRVGRRNSGDMAQQALTVRGQWPPAPPATPLDLDSPRGLLTSLMAEPVVTIHPELDEPDVCFVGAPVGLGEQSLRLLEVTPRGVWNSRPTKHRLEAVTRVDVGGRYEQALLITAGTTPSLT